MNISKVVFAIVFMSFSALGFAQNHNNLNAQGVIIDGYDAVAFFTEGKTVKGYNNFKVKYDKAIYYFSSKENMKLFQETPEKYKVQFGGYCAFAISKGSTAGIKIETWQIVDGRLIFNYNSAIKEKFNKNLIENLTDADKNWPKIKAKL